VDNLPESVYVDLRATALELEEVYNRVADPAAGGVSLFVGRVRDLNDDKSVSHLIYEAHPQAITALGQVAQMIASQPGVLKVAAVHRTGRLEIGDIAVICIVTSKHRDVAFAQCKELIDTLKREVPIWKNEFYLDGTEHWVGTP